MDFWFTTSGWDSLSLPFFIVLSVGRRRGYYHGPSAIPLLSSSPMPRSGENHLTLACHMVTSLPFARFSGHAVLLVALPGWWRHLPASSITWLPSTIMYYYHDMACSLAINMDPSHICIPLLDTTHLLLLHMAVRVCLGTHYSQAPPGLFLSFLMYYQHLPTFLLDCMPVVSGQTVPWTFHSCLSLHCRPPHYLPHLPGSLRRAIFFR